MGFNLLDASVTTLRSSGNVKLDWLYLVESIAVLILILFYFYYVPRVLGGLLSWGLRLWLWKSRNAYLEIGAFQFSLLGGRIMFSDFRYVSRNQSLRIHRGDVNWRYWLRRVRSEEDRPAEANVPTRLSVQLSGAEWFLYNRTPSYDAILHQLGVVPQTPTQDPFADPLQSKPSRATTDKHPTSTADFTSASSASREKLSPLSPDGLANPGQVEDNDPTRLPPRSKSSTDWLLEALPIEITCKTGSITLGSPATPSILIAGFEHAVGSYAAVKARSPLDLYKQVYKFTFANPKIIWRTNPDFEASLHDRGEQLLDKLAAGADDDWSVAELLRRPGRCLSLSTFKALLKKSDRKIKEDRKRNRSKGGPNTELPTDRASEWTGLPRYQTVPPSSPGLAAEGKGKSENQEGFGPGGVRTEYAKWTTLLDSCDELELAYYCDTAGQVPVVARLQPGFAGLESVDVGNGDLSPEWGVDMVLRGGKIYYGPWADRQRGKLQQHFTPTTFFDQKPTPRLRPGDTRLHTALKVFIEFANGATLHLPTRESSKDWEWDGSDPEKVHVRPYGWLDVMFGPGSSLSYVLPMVTTSTGYESFFTMHLDEMAVSSSVNHAIFVRASTCRVHCDLPNPIGWADHRTWTISTNLAKPDISLLRDHITLFSDIAKDWTSGPPGEYNQFVPFTYKMKILVQDITLRLYVNDHNVINNPTTIEDNTYVILSAPRVEAESTIPSDSYKMQVSTIPFDVAVSDMSLSMSLPDWNTHSAFLTPATRTFATSPEFTVRGSYRFYATASPENIERLELDVSGRDVVFKTMGWMLRHLFNLRDNYFGTFTHFVTLEEYRRRHEDNRQGDPLEAKYRAGQSDVFEVGLRLELTNALMFMPQEMYDCRSGIGWVIPTFEVTLRNHDFFMELGLNLDPFKLIETNDWNQLSQIDFHSLMNRPDSIRIQGLECTADRLFGPQPRTAVYICIWSFYIGSVVGSIPPSFLQTLANAASSIGLNFSDLDNSLPPDLMVAIDPDATFLTLNVHSIDLAVRGLGTAVQLDVGKGLTLRFDDLAAKGPFLKHIEVDVPEMQVRALAPLFGRAAPWMEVASIDADLSIVMGLSDDGWEVKAERQKEYLRQQDELTRRCPFLYGRGKAHPSRVGALFLHALENPIKDKDRRPGSPGRSRSRSAAGQISVDEGELSGDDSDVSDYTDSVSDQTDESSEDDYRTLYAKLPGREAGGDRFSAYGAILRLCERAPESAFLDRPTFKRMPRASTAEGVEHVREPVELPAPDERLHRFPKPAKRASCERTAVDIRSRRPIKVVLTPVAVQVGADVLEGFVVDQDLERCLDEMYATYLASQAALALVRFAHLELHANIAQVQVESIQDVLRPENTIILKRHDSAETEFNTTSGATVLCTVRLSFDRVAFSMDQTQDHFGGYDHPNKESVARVIERKLSGSVHQMRLEVFHPTRADPLSKRIRHVLPSTAALHRTRPTALDMTIGPSEASVELTSARALIYGRMGDARLDFVDEAAELVIGSLYSWRVVQDIISPLNDRAVDRALFKRRLMWSIVHAAEQAKLSSFPTFLNRVSYLVGSSSTLRSDDSWKLLHNLRHCLRSGEQAVVERTILGASSWPSNSSLWSDVIEAASAFESWDLDMDGLAHSEFLLALFSPNGVPVKAPTSLDPPGLISWDVPAAFEGRSGRFEAVLSHGNQTENQLSFGPGEAFVASSGRPNSSAQRVHVRGRATMHAAGAHVDRDLLLLIRHIITVRQTFERKIQLFRQSLRKGKDAEDDDRREEKATTEQSGSTDGLASVPGMLLDLSVGVKRFTATAAAAQVEANLRMDDVYLSLSGLVEPTVSSQSRAVSHQVNTCASVTIGGLRLSADESTTGSVQTLLSTELDRLSFVANAAGSHAWEGEGRGEVPTLQVILAAEASRTRIPKDAIRIHKFVDTWRAEELATYDTLLTELRQGLDDVNATALLGQPEPSSLTEHPSLVDSLLAKAALSSQVAISFVSVEMQAIPTLKVIYAIQNLSAYANSLERGASPKARLGPIDSGIHVGSQTVRFIPIADHSRTLIALPPATAFELPVVRVQAKWDGLPCTHVSVLATIDSVAIKLSAGIIDDALSISRHFGGDLAELFALLANKPSPPQDLASAVPSTNPSRVASSAATSAPKHPLAWDVRVGLRGLKIGVEGPQAIQWIEAELLEGRASSTAQHSKLKLSWQASVQNLALSLSQRAARDDPGQALSAVEQDRRYRLAFFRLDLHASNAAINLPQLPAASLYGDDDTPHVHLKLPKIHAVLQPTAVEALGDLIDYYEDEFAKRREERAEEVAKIQEKVIRTLDRAGEEAGTGSWLSECVVSLQAGNIGIAIPLGDGGIAIAEPPDVADDARASAQAHPAFLLTIPGLTFAAQKGSAGFAKIEQLALQFVHAFDPGRKQDFEGHTHPTRNRVLLPEMECTARSPKGSPTKISSSVSGLEIDLEPSVVGFGFALADLVKTSHERVAKFAPAAAPSSGTAAPPATTDDPASAIGAASPLQHPTPPTSLVATFEFASGTIRMRRAQAGAKAATGSRASPARPFAHRRGKSLGEFGTLRSAAGRPTTVPEVRPSDVFKLPGMSVWAEYKDSDNPRVISRLHTDVFIHSSNNVLYPTLLPFITDVSRQVKARALTTTPDRPPVATDQTSAPAPEPEPEPQPATTGALEVTPPAALGRLAFSMSLKVGKSDLQISCKPAAEVTARLTWESGGFLLSLSPELKGVQFAVTVDGVEAGLRHSFSPEDCLRAGAKGIAASVSFAQGKNPLDPGQVSAVVDLPDVGAEMNFRHLSDWLQFKAVWLDGIDLGSAAAAPTSASASAPARAPQPARRTSEADTSRVGGRDVPCGPGGSTTTGSVVTLVLVQLGRLRFECDLGPSIGRSTFVADEARARLRWVPGESRSASLRVKKFDLSGKGRLGGATSIDGLTFTTKLRDGAPCASGQASGEEAEDSGSDSGSGEASDLLKIEIGLGKIVGHIDYEFQKILVVNSDPVTISVGDDWSRAMSLSELDLFFDVKMGAFNVIVTTSTVPNLVGILHRVQVLFDEKAAQADALLVTAGLPPRSTQAAEEKENAVSAYASQLAKDPNAQASSTEAVHGHIRILNRLSIEMTRIRIACFPDHFNDGEIFRLDAGGPIRAQLVRGVTAEREVHRDLELFLGFFAVRKVNHRQVSSQQELEFGTPEWFEVFRTSTERNIFRVPTTQVKMESLQSEGSQVIRHWFTMKFGGQVDVALNYALLRNVGTLATTYRAKMADVTRNFDRLKEEQEGKAKASGSKTLASPTMGSKQLPAKLATLAVNTPSVPVTAGDVRASATPTLAALATALAPASPAAATALHKSTGVADPPAPAEDEPAAPEAGLPEPPSTSLIFEAVDEDMPNLQLNMLGDATPPVEWMGVQRKRFPGWVHTGVVGPLEGVVVGMSGVYRGELARQKIGARAGAKAGAGVGVRS